MVLSSEHVVTWWVNSCFVTLLHDHMLSISYKTRANTTTCTGVAICAFLPAVPQCECQCRRYIRDSDCERWKWKPNCRFAIGASWGPAYSGNRILPPPAANK